jgi:long-subunit fatty acid transport protein
MNHRLVPGLVVALGLASAGAATAQTAGYILPCSSASQLGRGCTLLAGTGDASTMLGDPAALAGLDRGLTVSGAAFMPTLHYANTLNASQDGKSNIFPMPALFYADRQRGAVTLGLGAQAVGGMGADYSLTNAVLGANQRYHSKIALMKGGLAAALQVSPQLTVGAMVGALYGQLEFATPYAVNPMSLAGMAGLAQDPSYATMMQSFTEATAYTNLTGLSGFGLTGALSVHYRPNSKVAIALAWTPASTLTLGGGTATMDMTAQFGQLYQGMVAAKGGGTAGADSVNTQLAGFGINMANGMATSFKAETDFGIPQTLTLAVGLRPSDKLSLGLDLGWIGYASAFKTMPMRMTGGTNANINILMNASPTNGSFSTAWPLAWKDSWVARAGAEVGLTPALSLRAGGIYGSNPVPSNTLFTIFPAVAEAAATVGVGYRMGSATVDLGYAHTFTNKQTGATPSLVAQEYAGATSSLGEDQLSAGVTWRF